MQEDYRPFIDFYNTQKVNPVKQGNYLGVEFLEKRSYLYSRLGIPLKCLKGADVLEVGAGGGYNATIFSSQAPERLVLIDGSDVGFAELINKLAEGLFDERHTQILKTDFLTWQSEEMFDFIFCEGTIPGQKDPISFTKKLLSNLRSNGIAVVTCTTLSSITSEILRRVMWPYFQQSYGEESEARAISYFSTHLQSLEVSTRSATDWFYDSIQNPWEYGKYIFDVSELLSNIGPKFEFVSALPNISTDLVWYKGYSGSENTNRRIASEWHLNDYNLLDSRVKYARVEMGETYYDSLRTLMDLHDKIRGGDLHRYAELISSVYNLRDSLPVQFEPTKRALLEFTEDLDQIRKGGQLTPRLEFSSWWGRAQVYISLRRLG